MKVDVNPIQQSLPTLKRLLVTRPQAEAERWTTALREQGWPAHALPLIQIGAPGAQADQSALAQARAHWAQWDALMFVSNAAVKWFFDGQLPVAGKGNATRFWAPGPGTARSLESALKGLNVPADRIDSPPENARQFDSEALWPQVRGQLAGTSHSNSKVGKRILIVRGASSDVPSGVVASAQPGQGRDWLIRQCESEGAEVLTCVAYSRCAPDWTQPMQELAQLASGPGSLWLLSSSESLGHLQTALPKTSWAGASALATHPRIAATARQMGFGKVSESRPALPDVLWALKSQWSPL